jgi:hypothetical protein
MSEQTSTYRRLAVVLLGLALWAPMLYCLHFYADRMAHRAHMWYEAKHEKLETFEVDSATIQWTKKNRELILNGEYFDIVSIKYNSGKATIKGVFDHKETKMHKAFSAATGKKSNHDHATQQIADWLQTGWFESRLDLSLACPINKTKNNTGWKNKPLPIPTLTIPPPPPWQAV